jgi:hypothetical protein
VGGDTDNIDIIGLLRFWAKNEGKKHPKFVKSKPKSAGFEQKSAEVDAF